MRNSYRLKSPLLRESAKHGLTVDLQKHIFSVRWVVFIFLMDSKNEVSINKAMAFPPHPSHFISCARLTSELTNQMRLPTPKNSKWKVPMSDREGTVSVFKELLHLEHHELVFHALLRASVSLSASAI